MTRLPKLLPILALAMALLAAGRIHAAPTQLVDEPPAKISAPADGVILVDFARVAFGNLRLTPPAGAKITVHFGESMLDGRVNRKPPGTVRYATTQAELVAGKPLVVAPPADGRNSKGAAAVLTPEKYGVILPFRWVEIEGWPGELKPEQIMRQSAFAVTWDDQAAAFKSSDDLLNRIWELCRYSIKATTFAGMYVDGDRERIPYEADAYLNQLSHYATAPDTQMARDTYDRLMQMPTWPTEWASHMVFMAHADWMQTGDSAWLGARYEALKTKLLLDRVRPDGLVGSNVKQVKHDDIVDWPTPERDGFVFTPLNTVVNAFYLRSLTLMAEMARALGKTADAETYQAQETKARAAFQKILFDPERKLYRDGETTPHTSLHSNLFPLAFGLVPEEHRAGVAKWLAGRGMACSVYAAQYLMEALFANDAGAEALALITAPNDRSWKHMVESGTTITWEAWDQKYKPNQDWNNAWGAAPANLLPRFVLGARALSPGWKRAVIRPVTGKLQSAEGSVPTPLGPVSIGWKNAGEFSISLTLPKEMTARVELPAPAQSQGVFSEGKALKAQRSGNRWILAEDVKGTVTLVMK